MSNALQGDSFFHQELRKASERLLWLGILLVVLGIAAIIFPLASSLVAALLTGWSLLVFGCIVLVSSFSIHRTPAFFGTLLLALLSLGGGVLLLFNPLTGVFALTLVVAIVFMLQGAVEIYFAVEMSPHNGWMGMLLSGIASVLIAALIASGWPGISVLVLGILLAVNFITTGLGYIGVSHALQRMA